jgi:hypothetical protein
MLETMTKQSDLTDMKFGKWIVLARAANHGKGQFWKCRCGGCKKTYKIYWSNLVKGKTSQCRHCANKSSRHVPSEYRSNSISNLTGQSFDNWEVLSLTKRFSSYCWICRCKICGHQKQFPTSWLTRKNTKGYARLDCYRCIKKKQPKALTEKLTEITPVKKLRTIYRRERISIAGRWCVYCGELATTREHYPPRTSTRGGFILPCCLLCNVTIGARWPFSFTRRTAEVQLKRKIAYPWCPITYLRLLGLSYDILDRLINPWIPVSLTTLGD